MASAVPSSSAGMSELYQPLEDRLEVGLFLGRDAIAGNFSVADALQVHGVDQLIHCQLIREIRLVAQDEQRDALQSWATHQGMKLLARLGQELYIGDVNNEDDRIDSTTISFPHGSEPRLPTQIPAFQGHMALLYFLHIESDSGNRTACHLGQPQYMMVTNGMEMTRSRMSLDSSGTGEGSRGLRLLDGELSALRNVALGSLYKNSGLGWAWGVLLIGLSIGMFSLHSEVQSW